MIYHHCINIDGAIKNARELRNCIETDSGKLLTTSAEVKEFLLGQKALGRRVLPCGDCDNFDYQTECKGHERGAK